MLLNKLISKVEIINKIGNLNIDINNIRCTFLTFIK